MARNQANGGASRPRSAGQKLATTLDDAGHAVTTAAADAGHAVTAAAAEAGHAVTTAAARTREEVDDIWAEARHTAGTDGGRDAAVYLGLAATAALGVVELPIAAAIGAGYAVFRRR